MLGVAFRHAPAGLAIPRDRPAFVARRVQLAEDRGAALDERLDLEVFLPHRAIAQVLRQAGAEQVGGLEEVPVRGDDEVLVDHGVTLLPVAKPTGRYNTAFESGSRRGRPGDEAVEATPGRLDLGRLG